MIVAGLLNLTVIRGCTFEEIVLTMLDSLGSPVNLTGFTVAAEVRIASGSPVIIDLAPTISNAAAGQVTIPEIADETTDTFDHGKYQWDFLLEETGTDNMQQVLRGKFFINNKITDS